MVNVDVVKGALPIVISALGGKLGVKIVFGGNQAATDGETVFLPALPADAEGPIRALAYGYGGHEASHIKNTCFDSFKELSKTGGWVASNIFNVLEDIRIEGAIIREFPGMGQTLNDLVEHLCGDGESFLPPTKKHGLVPSFIGWLLITRRNRVLRQHVLQDRDDAASAVLGGMVSPGFIPEAEDILATLGSIPGGKPATSLIVSMTEQLIELLKREQQQQPQQQPQSEQSDEAGESGEEGEPGEEGQAGSDGQTGGSGDKGDSGQDGQGGQADESGNAGDESSDGQDGEGESGDTGNGNGNGQGSSSQKENSGSDTGESQKEAQLPDEGSDAQDGDADGEADVSEAGRQYVEGLATDLGENSGKALKEEDRKQKRDGSLLPQTLEVGRPSAVKLPEGPVASQAGLLRVTLQPFFEAQARVRPRATRTGNRLMSSRLARVALGDSRVFRTQEEARSTSAAVHVLIDASGSMRGRAMEDAATAAAAVAFALKPIKGVSFGASAFNHLLIPLVKQGAKSFSGNDLYQSPSGSTSLGGAILSLTPMLTRLKEERKYLIVLTDGQPDESSDEIRKLIETLGKAGVEAFGLGFDGATRHSMSACFGQNFELLHGSGGLAPALKSLLQKKLVTQ